MIDIRDVHWRYAAATEPALRGFNLTVEPGEVVLLCGASGSGKSTALRLLNGLIPHFHDGDLQGTVRVAGLPVPDTPLEELGRRTGSVLQHPRRQFFTGAVGPELAFALENLGTDPSVIRRQVELTAADFGLLPLLERPLAALSGGEQQRVACAAAVTHRPVLVLFDEPTSNLSTDAIDHFVAGVRRLRAAGAAVVIAEHRLHPLRDVVDRVVVLRDGRVETGWTAAEFRRLDDATLASAGLRGDLAPVTGPRPAPPEHDHGLRLEDVRCAERGRPTLTLDRAFFPAGAVTAVRGPNGAGKTTLARVITGLQRHRGVVRLNGQPLGPARRQRSSALVMQDVQRQLFTDRVTAELTLGGSAVDDERVTALLADLDLLVVRDRHPLALSGGQQQRVAIAAARLSGKPIVIFDEPSSGVDRRHLASITRVIRELADEGAVVVVISHDEALLAPVADHALELVPPNGSGSHETERNQAWAR
ncbi:ABC transporter ATP-binding protein [Microlunatus parietis]|uniref:Energy-coupling factor transport system ATP-binding protein n=1 Tax=Microlunatus parietis TaxID=682979 RepID=A0A7Y9LAP4_9ACTN|nr:ABC transporter ATP-binding protein [Microlunatus parietis]NYE69810.1 energy-coupling factor transport system ATP-binding protein [Microlunatus parietis]